LNDIWFSDESHFRINGYVNKQNMRIWGTQKPEVYVEKSGYPQYLTVWCAISSKGFIGPYFFEDRNGKRTSVNQNTYQEMISNYFIPKLHELCGLDISNQVFMQDGASPHTAKATLNFLRSYFGENIISNNTDNIWPPYSPDLNPCDYFLWGYLKDKTFVNIGNFENLDVLKAKIIENCNTITSDMCRNVINNLKFRLHYCILK
jgi:hypothetical protein